ncbi:hypothetical protein [Actinacidiphila oryziradicis]|uniref:Uncharacterized protein n=1 Tax=Actinacidiphila oryziradicis TaxID=2571141 RepID=A0A4U0T912_9ACTN|nr:hypothetical protein [Actinacidiphila oryziradicis]TKA12445.1 hypothetical protein FCI23_06525 [Actinacidiphila oryziradicis]
MGAVVAFSGTDFDFLRPGAQVPLTGTDGETAATQALASAAYRDSPVDALANADGKTTVKAPAFSLFQPNLGEAFARAVEIRMLGGARNEVVQSFGAEPQTVVEHCLAATHIRKERDTRLTLLMGVFGLLFLPGVLIWLAVFQLRRTLGKANGSRAGVLGGAVLVVVGFFTVLLIVKPPLSGFWSQYLRVMMVAPVLGWFWAKRICERTAKDLRDRWGGLVSGGGVGAKIPGAVPRNPNETRAEALRQNLAKLATEQQSNVVFYAGGADKGILGMGSRWGSWQLAEELVPREGLAEIHPFRSWDVIKAIHGRLRELERGPLHTGGFPKPSIRHWVVVPIGEGADKIVRPTGAEVEGFTVKDFEIQNICNTQQFGKGNRHYLGVQFTGWDGQLVITFMITVTVLASTLRVEVSGHVLGPVHDVFMGAPPANEKTVSKTVRFWETRTVALPLVKTDEVVRLAARAPLTWFPPVLDHLGGKLALPEPFGVRHTWAGKPWSHRFMADDALRAATPVLRAVHSAAIQVLTENGVDTEKFTGRSSVLSGGVQGAEPGKADVYNA